MIRNPFITRGMIKSKKGFWDRTSEIQTLYSLLLDSEEEPQSAAIIGLRRIGKSSLLYHISRKYSAPEMYEPQLERMFCVMISMQSMSTATKEDFFFVLLEELRYQDDHLAKLVLTPQVSQKKNLVDRFRHILRLMDREEYLFVLLLDEFECAADNPNFDKYFFDLLRSLAQRWRIAFVVATQNNLDELWDKSLISSPYSSPFFNFFQTLTLAGFDEKETDNYLIATSQEVGLPFEEQDIELIKEIGGTHPFFLNVAAYHLFQKNLQAENTLIKNYEDLRLEITQDPTIDGNFKYYWQYLSAPRKNALLRVARSELNDAVSKVDLDWLHRRGLLRLDSNNKYVIFSEAFSQFILRTNDAASNQPTNHSEQNNFEIQDIISQDESTTLEFKLALYWDHHLNKKNENLADDVVKTIAAFLNTDGGTLLIGVENNGTVSVGLEKDYKYLKKKNGRDAFQLALINNLVSEKIGRIYCRYVDPKFYKSQGKDICKVIVKPSPKPVYVGREEIFYIRTGNSTQKLKTKEAHEYIKSHWPR